MEAIAFGGTYGDTDGSETINWLIRPSDRPGYEGRYEIVTMIRGIDIWGTDFDGLEPVDLDDPAAYERLHLNRANELAACVLTGDLPCGAEVDGRRLPGVVHFELDLTRDPNLKAASPQNLRPGFALTDSGAWAPSSAASPVRRRPGRRSRGPHRTVRRPLPSPRCRRHTRQVRALCPAHGR